MPPPRTRTLLVLYGSETGNAEELAEELGQCARRLHFDTRVGEMNSADVTSLLQPALVVIVVSTTGQGDVPGNGLVFWKKLLRRRLSPTCLARARFTTFGLGDSSYPKFNWAARKIHKRLEQLGAVEFYMRGEADERHDEGIDGTFLPWVASLRRYLLETHPLPDEVFPIPDHAMLPPRYPLPTVSQVDNASQEASAEGARVPIPNAWDATVVANERLTPLSHWQDVRLIRLGLAPPVSSVADPPSPAAETTLSLAPGDCLTVYPTNSPTDVDCLLDIMSWTAIADVPIRLSPAAPVPPRLYAPPVPEPVTLRILLTRNIDLAAVPRRSFLRIIAHFATDPDQRARLLEFVDPRLVDELWDYTTRPHRTILEVLQEFDSVRIPPECLLDVFPVLRGRDFSVANVPRCPKGSASSGAQTQVELLVALVQYRTILRRPRVGLCSAYLAPLAPGTTIRVSHRRPVTPLFNPAHGSRPLVAIATGTGIAPIRALIQERLARGGPGRMVLFFGARNRRADYYFSREWDVVVARARAGAATACPDNPVLEVFTAFSRDQRQKIYVQDAIREQAGLVARMVADDAVFCLCGGSAKMAESCKAAVTDAIRTQGLAGGEEAAKGLLGKLTWWQEVWP